MASIQSIVRNRKGTAGKWKVTGDGPTFTLWHYSTAMLEWTDYAHSVEVEDWSVGHGSVSDQQGMNQVFKLLGVPWYFSRHGGAEVVKVIDGVRYDPRDRV